MAEISRSGVKVRIYCTNTRCLFRKTCRKAREPEEGETVKYFPCPQDDINCTHYRSRMPKRFLIDNTQEYLERSYKKYLLCKKRVI